MFRPRRYGFHRSPFLLLAYAIFLASATCDRSVPRRARQAATSAAAEFEQSARPYVEKGKEALSEGGERAKQAATQAVEEVRELTTRAAEAARPIVERTKIAATQAAIEARELSTR